MFINSLFFFYVKQSFDKMTDKNYDYLLLILTFDTVLIFYRNVSCFDKTVKKSCQFVKQF